MSVAQERSDVLRWLLQAQYDWRIANSLVNDYPAAACFHAQQAAEKALKAAVLIHVGVQKIKSHSLRELLRNLEEHSLCLDAPAIRSLDTYYTMTRYPDMIDSPEPPYALYEEQEARSAVQIAATVIQQVSTWCVQHDFLLDDAVTQALRQLH